MKEVTITNEEKLGVRKKGVESMIEVILVFKEKFGLKNEEINFTDLIALAYKEKDMDTIIELMETMKKIGVYSGREHESIKPSVEEEETSEEAGYLALTEIAFLGETS